MTSSEDHAQRVLEHLGFRVERVPEQHEAKRADYLVSDDDARYLVEVKGRGIPKLFEDMRASAMRNGVSSVTRPIKPAPRFSNIIKEAGRQIDATPGSDKCFGVLWVSVLHPDSEFLLSQCESNLYGRMELFLRQKDQGPPFSVKTCFFFGHSDLYKSPGIDAVVLAGEGTLRLCVNPFAKRVGELRESKLYQLFSDRGACDPGLMEEEGRIFVLGPDVDRSSEEACVAAIRDKYGVVAEPMVFQHHTGLALVEDDALESHQSENEETEAGQSS